MKATLNEILHKKGSKLVNFQNSLNYSMGIAGRNVEEVPLFGNCDDCITLPRNNLMIVPK